MNVRKCVVLCAKCVPQRLYVYINISFYLMWFYCIWYGIFCTRMRCEIKKKRSLMFDVKWSDRHTHTHTMFHVMLLFAVRLKTLVKPHTYTNTNTQKYSHFKISFFYTLFLLFLWTRCRCGGMFAIRTHKRTILAMVFAICVCAVLCRMGLSLINGMGEESERQWDTMVLAELMVTHSRFMSIWLVFHVKL